MFKFVHVWEFGFKGKLDGGRIIRLKAISKNLSAVRERLYGARPKKNWVGGRVGFSTWQKVAQKKNLPGLFATSGKDVLQSRVHWDVI